MGGECSTQGENCVKCDAKPEGEHILKELTVNGIIILKLVSNV
jgi:hypothetical protein